MLRLTGIFKRSALLPARPFVWSQHDESNGLSSRTVAARAFALVLPLHWLWLASDTQTNEDMEGQI